MVLLFETAVVVAEGIVTEWPTTPLRLRDSVINTSAFASTVRPTYVLSCCRWRKLPLKLTGYFRTQGST